MMIRLGTPRWPPEQERAPPIEVHTINCDGPVDQAILDKMYAERQREDQILDEQRSRQIGLYHEIKDLPMS